MSKSIMETRTYFMNLFLYNIRGFYFCVYTSGLSLYDGLVAGPLDPITRRPLPAPPTGHRRPTELRRGWWRRSPPSPETFRSPACSRGTSPLFPPYPQWLLLPSPANPSPQCVPRCRRRPSPPPHPEGISSAIPLIHGG